MSARRTTPGSTPGTTSGTAASPGQGTVAGGARSVWPAVVADVLCVVVFTIVGTANHESAGSLAHVALVGLPFLVALAVGWLAARAWRAPARVWPTGVALWVATVALGLALRPLFGGGLAVSFAIVTAVFLGATLLGWRALAALTARARPTSG